MAALEFKRASHDFETDCASERPTDRWVEMHRLSHRDNACWHKEGRVRAAAQFESPLIRQATPHTPSTADVAIAVSTMLATLPGMSYLWICGWLAKKTKTPCQETEAAKIRIAPVIRFMGHTLNAAGARPLAEPLAYSAVGGVAKTALRFAPRRQHGH